MSGLPPNLGAELAALQEEVRAKTAALAGVEAALADAESGKDAAAAALAAERAAHAQTRQTLAGVRADLARFTEPVSTSGGQIVLRQIAETPDGHWHATPLDAQIHLAVCALCEAGMTRPAAQAVVKRAGALAPILAQIAAGEVVAPPVPLALAGRISVGATGRL